MDRNIAFINILVTAAPLIGLLGTVMGMLMTFQSIGLGGGEMAEMMAKGISAALLGGSDNSKFSLLPMVISLPIIINWIKLQIKIGKDQNIERLNINQQ